MTNWQILQFPAKIFIPLVVAIENLIFSVSSPLDRLYKIHAILHNIAPKFDYLLDEDEGFVLNLNILQLSGSKKSVF